MIGRLRHRLTVQRPDRTADVGGGATITWTDVARVWGAVEPISGRETVVAERQQATVTHKVTLRYRADLDARMRILFGSRSFNIRSLVNPDERGRWLICLCEEGGAL